MRSNRVDAMKLQLPFALALCCMVSNAGPALASALAVLQTDPQALGKRFQLTADLPAAATRQVERIPGVQAAAPRNEDHAVDSFSLGETVDVIGYPGDHTTFEAPPLTAGHRIRGAHQAEVGAGLANALGLSPGLVHLPPDRAENDDAGMLTLGGILCRYVNSQAPPIVISQAHAWVVVGYRRVSPESGSGGRPGRHRGVPARAARSGGPTKAFARGGTG